MTATGETWRPEPQDRVLFFHPKTGGQRMGVARRVIPPSAASTEERVAVFSQGAEFIVKLADVDRVLPAEQVDLSDRFPLPPAAEVFGASHKGIRFAGVLDAHAELIMANATQLDPSIEMTTHEDGRALVRRLAAAWNATRNFTLDDLETRTAGLRLVDEATS